MVTAADVPGQAARRASSTPTGRSSWPRARRRATSATCWPRSPRRRATAPVRPRPSSRSSYEVAGAGHRPLRGPGRRRPGHPRRRQRARRRPWSAGATRMRPSRPRPTSSATASRTAAIEHAYLEPEAVPRRAAGRRGSAAPDGTGRAAAAIGVHVLSQGQGAWEDRRQIASFLGLAPTDVLVTQVATGGAFGGKEDLNVQAAGGAARACDRAARDAARCRAPRACASHVKRHPFWMDYTVGVRRGGPPRRRQGPHRRRQRRLRQRRRQGPGARRRPRLRGLPGAQRGRRGARRLHEQPAVRRHARLRGQPGRLRASRGCSTGSPRPVGIDGWEIRWRNAVAEGDRFGTGQRLGPGVGLKETLLAVREPYRAARYAGIACGAKNTGVGNGLTERGRAVLRPEADGTLTLFHSWTEMGQGVHTVFRQIAAAELGLDAGSASASSWTRATSSTPARRRPRGPRCSAGGRCCEACAQASARSWRAAAATSTRSPAQEFAGEFVVDWTTPLGAAVDEPVTHFGYGWATQVVILDDEGRIEQVVAAHDVGRAHRPADARGPGRGRRPHGPRPHADRGLRHAATGTS